MIKLHSTILGEGQPFLILHGFLGMSDNWKTLGNKFAEAGYQVHLLDQRNHGRSPHTPEMNYEVLAKDIFDYCQTHKLRNVILLGHSMGGKAAMLTAGKYPDLIDKLIVVDISPKYYTLHHQQIMEGLSALENENLTSRGEAEEFLSKFVGDRGTRMFLLKNLYWETREKLSLRLNLKVLKETIEEIGAALPPGFKFEKSTLFIKGGKSNYISKDDESLIASHFPLAEIKIIPNAGHWVHAEKTKDFYDNVQRFLTF